MKDSKKIYQEFGGICDIGVSLEHNGYKGGDASHGGFVKIEIENLCLMSMSLNGREVDQGETFELLFSGDCERDVLISALKMMVKELEDNPSI